MMAADMQLLSSAIIPAKNLMRLFTLDTVVAHETPERHWRCMRVDRAGENRSTPDMQKSGHYNKTFWIIQERLAPTMRSSGLNMKWWPEILRTIATTNNLSPSSVLDYITRQ